LDELWSKDSEKKHFMLFTDRRRNASLVEEILRRLVFSEKILFQINPKTAE
jgi:hypothetical protein